MASGKVCEANSVVGPEKERERESKEGKDMTADRERESIWEKLFARFPQYFTLTVSTRTTAIFRHSRKYE